jgi:hypothetical protein
MAFSKTTWGCAPIMRFLSLLLLWFACSLQGFAQTGGFGSPISRDQQNQANGQVRGGRPGTFETRPLASLPRGVREVQPGVFMVTGTRPLEIASQLLMRKLGVPISFEEATWSSPKDVSLASHERNVTVSIPTPVSSKNSVIQAALDSHRLNSNPGEFKVIRFGDDNFGIVADFAEDQKGTMIQQVNPLDFRISFPEADRTVAETLNLIYRGIDTITKMRGFAFIPVGPRVESFNRVNVRVGANNEIARDVLARTLRHQGLPRIVWSVRFDPGAKTYGVWFQPAQEEVLVPGHGVVLRSLPWPK